jgi:putative ABC transport system ATP-binding protein
MNKIIELNKVVKLYQRGTEKVHAVDGISISVNEGEFLSIAGPSGSGKTTLLNLIGCVDKPTSGSIRLANTDITILKEKEFTKIRATTIGFVFQQFFLLPTLTALENVELPLLFSRKGGRNNRAKELLNLVGLANRENHLPSQLSGGEMQRVAIARALINGPKILLADEPTGNLDSQNACIIIDIFKRLNQRGLTIILVTHNIEFAKIAKRAFHLKDGKIIKEERI